MEVLKKLAEVFEVPIEYFLVDDENTLAKCRLEIRSYLSISRKLIKWMRIQNMS